MFARIHGRIKCLEKKYRRLNTINVSKLSLNFSVKYELKMLNQPQITFRLLLFNTNGQIKLSISFQHPLLCLKNLDINIQLPNVCSSVYVSPVIWIMSFDCRMLHWKSLLYSPLTVSFIWIPNLFCTCIRFLSSTDVVLQTFESIKTP